VRTRMIVGTELWKTTTQKGSLGLAIQTGTPNHLVFYSHSRRICFIGIAVPPRGPASLGSDDLFPVSPTPFSSIRMETDMREADVEGIHLTSTIPVSDFVPEPVLKAIHTMTLRHHFLLSIPILRIRPLHLQS
jgi:hypothetical protein